MESRRGEDEKKQVGEGMCGEEVRRRAVERRRAVARKKGGELWQGGDDEGCDKKERRRGG